jgi:hypothetical protein
MKKLIAIALASLVTITTTSASAYIWGPPNTTSRVSGRIMLFPDNGGAGFYCKLRMIAKTDGGTGKKARAKIVSVIASGGAGCSTVVFFTPWQLGAVGPSQGALGRVAWIAVNGEQCEEAAVPFTVNNDGTWTFGGGICVVSGTLTADPVLTINR